MPPRGSEGLDFTPILTHYLFLFTTILAVVCPQPLSLFNSLLTASTVSMVYRIHLTMYRNCSMSAFRLNSHHLTR